MFSGMTEWVLYAGYAAVGGVVFLVAHWLMREEETRAAQENLEDLRNRPASNPLIRFTRPLFSQYLVPMVRGKTLWENRRKVYRRRLVTAGLKEELTPDELIAFKMSLVFLFPVACGFANVLAELGIPGWFITISPVLGWFYPDFLIRSRISARQKQIRKSMPFIVDLLALSTEAGLDFMGAISKVVEKANPSPLVEEFEQLLKEIRVGSSRSEALREMAVRIDMTEVSSFIAILISADQMGASIGKILRQQSDQVRTDRFVRAEKAGAIASQQLLLPLVLFILPAVMLMIFGPFLLSTFSTGL
jgi:tight adherence protein C